ncbi:hypothetical protein ACS0TY_018052 [Phlomoides rotata]
MFLCKASEENVIFLRRFLWNLEIVSGLKVDKNKCKLFGLNVHIDELAAYADTLGCKTGTTPFTYLGVKVGCRHTQVSEWDYVIQKIKNRLRRWEGLKISIGGRLTLLNAVLSSLPVYFLSTYRAPKSVVRENVKLHRIFFWGVVRVRAKCLGSSGRQYAIIKSWGLGVKNIECFNKALMGKWAWRFLVEKGSLWTRVIKSRWGLSWSTGGGVSRRKDRLNRWVGGGRFLKWWEGWRENGFLGILRK